jgi:hypothetical protein
LGLLAVCDRQPALAIAKEDVSGYTEKRTKENQSLDRDSKPLTV